MPRIGSAVMVALLRLYRVIGSPILQAVGVRCRHEPSCSVYGIEVVQRHGAWRGFWLGLARFSRCRPFGSSGYDPAPETVRRAPWYAPWLMGDWRGPRRDRDASHVEPEHHA